MTKILIVGIGGVGGYFGGLLAHHFKDSKEVSVSFMVRGKNLDAIKHEGLLVTKGKQSFIAHPAIASVNPADFGKVDYIILCTKSYDIEETVRSLSACVKAGTIFLPLLNGVDSVEKIRKIYPDNMIVDGCVYIISRLVAPGHVQNLGDKQFIYFGIPNEWDSRLSQLESIFREAGIDGRLTRDITTRVWEKFIFISASATITSYYNKNFGEIKECRECIQDLYHLIDECVSVAHQKNIQLPPDIRDKVRHQILNLIPDATTSMHSDYVSGKGKSEVQSLTGYIVHEAKRLDVYVPTYQRMFEKLTMRIKKG